MCKKRSGDFEYKLQRESSIKEIEEVIAVNPYDAKDEINLSEIADSVKCIKLETKKAGMLFFVRKV